MMFLFIVLAVLVIYSRSIRGEFVFDDHAITDMNFERWKLAYRGKDRPEDVPSFGKALFYGFMEPRSLTHMGYVWTWQLAGLQPVAWHAVNIGLHLVNTFLVFLLALNLRPGVAVPAAFLFSVHPHQVAAVSYISGRASLQTTAFALASVYIAFTLNASYLLFQIPALWFSALFANRSKEDGNLWTVSLLVTFKVLGHFFGSI